VRKYAHNNGGAHIRAETMRSNVHTGVLTDAHSLIPIKKRIKENFKESTEQKKIAVAFSETKHMIHLADKKHVEWILQISKTYKKLDIVQEIELAESWLLSNPKKLKSNYRAFINNWFNRVLKDMQPKDGEEIILHSENCD